MVGWFEVWGQHLGLGGGAEREERGLRALVSDLSGLCLSSISFELVEGPEGVSDACRS